MRVPAGLKAVAVAVAGMTLAVNAQAAPILYQGELQPGVTQFGQVLPEPDTNNPVNGDWWSFEANAGDRFTITGHRLEAALDPAFNLYFGFGDTDLLQPVGFADDDISELPGLDGPFSDPELTFVAAETGTYSVFLWSFLSDDPGPDGVYDYQLTLTVAEVPEPAGIALLGAGLLGLAGLRRRKA